uniref:Vacuolar protein sorting 55 n=1 Tax=Calcidiscus leptoporus TaxID=127549 RepID=A0A7S0J070_9EUKA|mmetsp:Transcript_31492/g.73305  ORF Transcript_31492/g.73305 Transcript_31492/m.73305 type:complete len:125 (+) Transcript_31492:308-682(+)
MDVWHLLLLAALVSGALFMHILSCALYNNWWPMLLVLAYLLMPIPLVVIARARGDGFLESGSKHVLRWGEFFAAFVFSLIVGVPLILLRAEVVELGAVLMDLSGLVLAVAAGAFAAFISHQPDY